ncbi:MAG: DUF6352 family protein [Elsteraceae bacterium]
MTDFWRSSGYHFLDPDENGRLQVTDAYLKAYLARPELAPIEESCAAERTLHAALLKNPREAVSANRLGALADPDARENYQVALKYRDWLVRHGTLEAGLVDLARNGNPGFPPMFLDQMIHAVLRGVLDGVEDPMRLRAAELLFRPQKVTIQDGAILAADEETVEMHARTGGLGDLGRLIIESGTAPRSVELDVMTEDNKALYWERSERFDMVLDLTFGRPGLDALARVLEAWVAHLLGAAVQVQPVARISDERWSWHVGLDAEASAVMNDLFEAKPVDEARLARVVALFRLEFRDPAQMLPRVAGRPVYLGAAMTEAGALRLKGQNLLANLPLARAT